MLQAAQPPKEVDGCSALWEHSGLSSAPSPAQQPLWCGDTAASRAAGETRQRAAEQRGGEAHLGPSKSQSDPETRHRAPQTPQECTPSSAPLDKNLLQSEEESPRLGPNTMPEERAQQLLPGGLPGDRPASECPYHHVHCAPGCPNMLGQPDTLEHPSPPGRLSPHPARAFGKVAALPVSGLSPRILGDVGAAKQARDAAWHCPGPPAAARRLPACTASSPLPLPCPVTRLTRPTSHSLPVECSHPTKPPGSGPLMAPKSS